MHNKLVLVTKRAVSALFEADEPDEKARSRLAMDVRRLAQTDRELAAMGANVPDDDGAEAEVPWRGAGL